MSAKERPILFSGPMVRAVLDGRKTQTRRAVKGLPFEPDRSWPAETMPAFWFAAAGDHQPTSRTCPYGAPGDRLWVKESGLHKRGPLFELFIHDATPDRYWASPDHGGEKLTPEARGKRGAGIGPALTRDQHKGMGFKARPSIHMPRWASRLTLQITDVRVERLQDISAADAKAEGCDPVHMQPGGPTGNPRDGWLCYRAGFERLWASINGQASWDANPWVWAVSFEVAS